MFLNKTKKFEHYQAQVACCVGISPIVPPGYSLQVDSFGDFSLFFPIFLS